MTAEQIALAARDRVGAISTQAVYDVLGALTRRRLRPQDRTGRQPGPLRDARRDNHHHVVCRSCGAITDVDCVIGDPPCVTPADASGFVVDEAEVTFWGLCPDCQTTPKHRDKERRRMTDQPPRTTTDAGIPVASDEYSLTVGPDGPILLQDHYLIEQMANFNRERIPERQPHAKGVGRVRRVRGDRGRQRLHPGRGCSSPAPRPRCSPASRPWPASAAAPTPGATRAASR